MWDLEQPLGVASTFNFYMFASTVKGPFKLQMISTPSKQNHIGSYTQNRANTKQMRNDISRSYPGKKYEYGQKTIKTSPVSFIADDIVCPKFRQKNKNKPKHPRVINPTVHQLPFQRDFASTGSFFFVPPDRRRRLSPKLIGFATGLAPGYREIKGNSIASRRRGVHG